MFVDPGRIRWPVARFPAALRHFSAGSRLVLPLAAGVVVKGRFFGSGHDNPQASRSPKIIVP